MSNLTIIVPVRQRDAFTERFLRYHGHLGHEIRIAEGDDPDFKSLFRKVFRQMFHDKPYTLFADHDDLLVPQEIERHVDFLNSHGDYVACGGRIAGFAVRGNNPYGKIRRFTHDYAPYNNMRDFCNASPESRVLCGFDNAWSYYAVVRSPIAFQIQREIVEMGLSDSMIHEKFHAMRLLSLGKVRGFTEISYLKQYNTTSRDLTVDWASQLLAGNLSNEINAVLNKIAPLDNPGFRDELRLRWANWYRDFIFRYYGPRAALGFWAKKKAPWIIGLWRNRRNRGMARLRHSLASSPRFS